MRNHLNPLTGLLSLALSVQISCGCEERISMPRDKWYIGVGQNFTLQCSVMCLNPSSTLRWYLNDTFLSNMSEKVMLNYISANYTYRLDVNGATKRDSGTYHCQTNPAGAQSNNVFIEVADLDVKVSKKFVKASVGESVSVNCTAISNLNVTHFWARGSCEANNTLYSNTLILHHVTTTDSGNYYCCAYIATRTPFHKSEMVEVKVVGASPSVSLMPVYYLLAKGVTFLLFVIFCCFLTY